MPTTPADELAVQRRWRMRGSRLRRWLGLRRLQARWRLPANHGWLSFDDLIPNEFMDPGDRALRQRHALRRLLDRCRETVPHYRSTWSRLGIRTERLELPADLHHIPVLTRSVVQEEHAALRATALPSREPVREVTTSGTTGHPVRIVHTLTSLHLIGVVKQRELRWLRWEPSAVLASIRPPHALPRGAGRRYLEKGETGRLEAWPRVGRVFRTGPSYGLHRGTPVEDQLEWLADLRPAYVVAQPADLEMLALAVQAGTPLSYLRGILAVSQETSDAVRDLIERTFGVPLELNYGLNEIGLVATWCREGARYHVHSEVAHVEVVDRDGLPCRAGEKGRILVTALRNPAMPLLRYDTDDLAETADGPCPCGRTLPSFGRVHGRYRRLVDLPPGTMDRVSVVQDCLTKMPVRILGGLRQYRLHQCRDHTFELRIVVARPLPPAFAETIRERWRAADPSAEATLRIIEVSEIPRPPGGKQQNFTSDFVSQPADG